MRARSAPGRSRLTVAAGFAAALALGAAPPVSAQPAADARVRGTMTELANELGRLQRYLAYADQVARMEMVLGTLRAEEAEQRLTERGATLYRQRYTDADLDALLNRHRAVAQAYFQRIQQAIGASRQWPAGAPATAWQARARAQLQQAQADYAARLSRRDDTLPALRRANEPLAWASGSATLPAHLDHFAGQLGRVMAAIPSRATRLVPALLGQAPLAPVQTTAPPITVVTPGVTRPPGPPIVAPGGGALERGNALLNQWKWHEALTAFDEALRADPGSPDALLGRGRALNALGDLAGAIQAYDAALRVRPDVPHVRVWIAELLMGAGDYARAQTVLQEELQRFPSAWARSYEGTLHLLAGRRADTERTMAEALRQDPWVGKQRYDNGTALAAGGQHRRAVIEFSSVLALDPNAAGAYFGLGTSLAGLGATAQAIDMFEEYLRRDSSSEWAGRARESLARLRAQGTVAPGPATPPAVAPGPPIPTPPPARPAASPSPSPSPASPATRGPAPAGPATGVITGCPPGTVPVSGGCLPAR